MAERKKNKEIHFYVTEEERKLIRRKMIESKTKNMGAYLRKMAIDGYIVNTDIAPLKKQYEEMHKIGVNINQIARRLNEEAKAGRLRGTEAAQFLKLSTALTNRMEHVVGKVGDLIKASRARCKLVEVARENQS